MNITDQIDTVLYNYERQQARAGRFPDLIVVGVNVERALFELCTNFMDPTQVVDGNTYRGVKIIVSRSLRPDEIWCPPPH